MEYIYILINPSIPGKVKIGKTTTSPEKRAQELSSSTGVPSPFFVAYEAIVSDCSSAEREIHLILESQGYRVNTKREFFDISLKDAVSVVSDICSRFEHNEERDAPPAIKGRSQVDSARALYLEVLKLTCSYEYEISGYDYRRMDVLHRQYYFSDEDNLFLGLPEELEEKLNLSSTLGCRESKGWLLYLEAWHYFYGYYKIKDNDVFVDKMIESLSYGFQGAYLTLADMLNGMYCLEGDEEIYTSFTGYNFPDERGLDLSRFSSQAIKKLNKISNNHTGKLYELYDASADGKITAKELQTQIDIAGLNAAITLISKGISSGEFDLCPAAMNLIERRALLEISVKYTDFTGDNESFYSGNHNYNVQNLALKNDLFKHCYKEVLTKNFQIMKQCFEIHMKEGYAGIQSNQESLDSLIRFIQTYNISVKSINWTIPRDSYSMMDNLFLKYKSVEPASKASKISQLKDSLIGDYSFTDDFR